MIVQKNNINQMKLYIEKSPRQDLISLCTMCNKSKSERDTV